MTFSLPSALAAATNASIPPQAEADVAVLTVDSLQEAVPPPGDAPQAATKSHATAATPRWRVKLATFILSSPPNRPRLLPNQIGRPIMAAARRCCKDTSRACG